MSYSPENKCDPNFLENAVYAADSNFFLIFDLRFLKANPKTAAET